MARKGDYVVIERRSSYTSLKTGTHQNWDWYIGKVTSATRAGVVKSAEFYGQNEGFPIWTQQAQLRDRGSWWRAYSLSDEYQSAGPVEVSTIAEYGLEQKLSASVRCF